MINLLVALILMCSSLGAVISKTTTDYGFRKQRKTKKFRKKTNFIR